jgi:fatty acid desaturase
MEASVMPLDNTTEDIQLRKQLTEIRLQRRVELTWLAIGVIFSSYAVGWYLILFPTSLSFIGVLLVAEAMILSWYLGHECAHLMAFQTRNANIILGEVLAWVTGGAFFPFKDYGRDHLRHHAEQIDLIGVDLQQRLQTYPTWMRSMVLGLEAIYVPAVFLLVKIESIQGEIHARGKRRIRALGVSAIYGLIYGAVGTFSPVTLILYIVAVIVRIQCVRFVDAFQHTYDHIDSEQRVPPRGREYEQHNTFSFPVFRRLKFLNLLILNFGFHNAHHATPNCPWYNLPKIDQVMQRAAKLDRQAKKYPALEKDIGIWGLLHAYHKRRVERIAVADAGTAYGEEGRFSLQGFRGAFTDNLLG